MGAPPKPLHLVFFLTAIFTTAFFFFFYSYLAGDPAENRTNRASSASTFVTTSSATHLSFLPDDGNEVQVEVVSGEDNVGSSLRSLFVDAFRVLLGLKSQRPNKAGHAVHVFAPAPAPMEARAAAPAPLRLPRRPSRGYSHSPLPRPSRIPPVEDVEVRRGGSSKAKALRIVAATAVSVGAMLAIVALTVVLLRHRSRRGRASGTGAAMDKVGFDPGVELYYLDTFAPGLPEQLTSPPHSSHSEAESTPSRSPPSSGKKWETEEDESFHSVSICDSHPSPLRHSDASDTCDPTHPSEPPLAAFAVPFALKPPSSPPPGLGFGRRVRSDTEVSLPQPPPEKVASAAASSSVLHGGRPPGSSPSLSSSSSRRGSSLRMDSEMPSSSACMGSSSSIIALPTKVTPSSSSPNTATATGSIPNPSAKKCSEEPKQRVVTPSVGNGNVAHQPPPPLLPCLPPLPPPPPPPPPSFKKGSGNRGQAPPPPPRQLQPFSTPVGKDGSPLPKLKPLHWDKVRATPDRSMVWDKIRSSSFELDEEMIESLFGYNLQSSGRTEEARSKGSSPSKHVLEPKRLQNFTILLKALNATSDQICGALLRGGGLCAQQLEALSKMVPTKEEEERLLCFEGDVTELDPAERFVREILSTPCSFPRIEVMLYRETFEDEVAYLRKSFQTLEEACKELRSSRLFLRLLEAVLKTGNRMNVGTTRGGARAFKLDALLKLADVKGTDGKTTLLHFVVQEIVRSEGAATGASMAPEEADKKEQQPPKATEDKEDDHRAMGLELVSGLSTELRHVKTAAGVDLDALASSISNLSAGLQQLQRLLEHPVMKSDFSQGGFAQSVRSFSNYAAKTIRELEEDEGRVLRLVKEITEYYHGDVGKEEANPLGIFVIVRDFLGMLDRVCKEVRSWRGNHSPPMAAPFR